MAMGLLPSEAAKVAQHLGCDRPLACNYQALFWCLALYVEQGDDNKEDTVVADCLKCWGA